jgi:dolichyl-phosphate beta-glucosyltransferase
MLRLLSELSAIHSGDIMTPSLSVVIPAYNEEAAIQAGKIDQVIDWLETQPFNTELIVVDDQSQDNTAVLAQAAVLHGEKTVGKVVQIHHAGKAAAVIAGIHAAAGEWVLFTDMDQATPITEAPRLLKTIHNGCHIAAGSRGIVRPGAPLGRYLLSWGQVILKTVLLGLRITDTQCGFKAFTRQSALEIIDHLVVYDPTRLGTLDGPSVTSGFDVEFLYLGQRLGYRICEVPVKWHYQQTRRVNLLRDARRGFLDLFKIVLARLRRKYPRRK